MTSSSKRLDVLEDAVGYYAQAAAVERQPYDAVYRQIDPRTGADSAGPAAGTPYSPSTWPGCRPPSRMPPPSGSSSWNVRPRTRPGSPAPTPM